MKKIRLSLIPKSEEISSLEFWKIEMTKQYDALICIGKNNLLPNSIDEIEKKLKEIEINLTKNHKNILVAYNDWEEKVFACLSKEGLISDEAPRQISKKQSFIDYKKSKED